MYVCWVLSRTYLPSLKRKLGPFPGPSLVAALGRVLQVTWYGHRGRSFACEANPCCHPNALSRSVPSNRLVPVGDIRLDFVVFSTEIHHFASFWVFWPARFGVMQLIEELDHAEGEASARGYARGSPVQKGRTGGH